MLFRKAGVESLATNQLAIRIPPVLDLWQASAKHCGPPELSPARNARMSLLRMRNSVSLRNVERLDA